MSLTASTRLGTYEITVHEETIRVPPHLSLMLRVSPDGQYVVLDARDEEMDLWLWSRRCTWRPNISAGGSTRDWAGGDCTSTTKVGQPKS